MTTSLDDLTQAILAFRDERDWGQFHTPRHLASAIAIEAAELQEVFLWRSDSEALELARGARSEHVGDEIADVIIYALLLANSVGIDPSAAIKGKLSKNAEKYPVALSKGRATNRSHA